MSLTTPFRGAVTVLEVVTPNPSASKKRKEVSSSTALDKSRVLGSPWIFIRPRRMQVFFFFTDKGISLLLALFTSLNGTDGERSRYGDVFVFGTSGLESAQETRSK